MFLSLQFSTRLPPHPVLSPPFPPLLSSPPGEDASAPPPPFGLISAGVVTGRGGSRGRPRLGGPFSVQGGPKTAKAALMWHRLQPAGLGTSSTLREKRKESRA